MARRALVLATGQRPWIPPLFEAVPHWTNRQAIATDEVPPSLLVVGGGAVGLEIGQAMSRFGSQVTVVELGPRLLDSEEPETSALIAKISRARGDRGPHRCADRLGRAGGRPRCHRAPRRRERAVTRQSRARRRPDGAATWAPSASLSWVSTRRPRPFRSTDACGWLPVSGPSGTSRARAPSPTLPCIRPASAWLTSWATPADEADYRALPRVTFTDPEIGSVGLTEAEAREQGGEVTVLAEPIPDSARGWIHGGDGFVKLVSRRRRPGRSHLHGADRG